MCFNSKLKRWKLSHAGYHKLILRDLSFLITSGRAKKCVLAPKRKTLFLFLFWVLTNLCVAFISGNVFETPSLNVLTEISEFKALSSTNLWLGRAIIWIIPVSIFSLIDADLLSSIDVKRLLMGRKRSESNLQIFFFSFPFWIHSIKFAAEKMWIRLVYKLVKQPSLSSFLFAHAAA